MKKKLLFILYLIVLASLMDFNDKPVEAKSDLSPNGNIFRNFKFEFAENEYNDKCFNFKNKIKSKHYILYHKNNNDKKIVEKLNKYEEYNTRGSVIKLVQYENEIITINYKVNYFFDKYENEIVREYIHPDNHITKFNISYNDHSATLIINTDVSSREKKINYYFNEKGNIIKKIEFLPYGSKLTTDYKYKYDSNANIIELISLFKASDDPVIRYETVKNEYDILNNLLHQINLRRNINVKEEDINYNVEEPGGTVISEYYKCYNNNNSLIKNVEYLNGTLESTVYNEYCNGKIQKSFTIYTNSGRSNEVLLNYTDKNISINDNSLKEFEKYEINLFKEIIVKY